MPVQPRFSLGQTVITRRAFQSLTQEEVIAALGLHVVGDWGDVAPALLAANERALVDDEAIVSIYRSPSSDARFYVLTSADRSMTTVFMLSETNH